MYTVIFHRESENSCGDKSPSVLKVTYCDTMNEVTKYIKSEYFEQLRLQKEARVYDNRNYYYGDFGFMTMKDGIVVEMDYSFSDAFDEWEVVSKADVTIYNEILAAKYDAEEWFGKVEDFKKIYVQDEEKLLQVAMAVERNNNKIMEQEEKDRELLKVLMEKYPEVR